MDHGLSWDARADDGILILTLGGRFDERTDFSIIELAGHAHIVFELSGLQRINSWGARQWIMFLRSLPVEVSYRFEHASIEFIKHCNMIADMAGRGRIDSFFAPYVCEPCRTEVEHELVTAELSRAVLQDAPTFECPTCGGDEILDDLPRRYFAFLPL